VFQGSSPELVDVEPFRVDIDEEVLDDLRRRLASTRWPDEVAAAGWDYGTSLDYLKELCAYWLEEFDWRAQEEKLNAFDQFRGRIGDQWIHFVHVRSGRSGALPLIATHGWPSTFFELLKLVPRLTAGPSGEPAFDLVIPSMPGYGFSSRPTERYFSASVPELWRALMEGLGYPQFFAHGGDIGGGVTARLGQRHPDAVLGIHVTNVYGSIAGDDPPPSEAERRYLEQEESWRSREWAYGVIQGQRPQTLGYGLNDSPAGLAAWIVEKYRAWSDCGGDVETVFTKDELLTNITLYWVTETITSSFRPYWDRNHDPDPSPWAPIAVPTGVAIFPGDLARPPREFAERSYNVQQWTEMPRGGHFAALEQPDLLAADIRRFCSTIARRRSACGS
jgi:pimeloyl-ACP methyl ester carboxylesterase